MLEKCGAIPSTHDYHVNRFLLEHFPEGTEFRSARGGRIERPLDLPVSDAIAFSIDDAATTEIDDAFSVTPLTLGSFRIGIHIAAPDLGNCPRFSAGLVAAERLSTVYLPGGKITMLPEAVIQHYTLVRKAVVPGAFNVSGRGRRFHDYCHDEQPHRTSEGGRQSEARHVGEAF